MQQNAQTQIMTEGRQHYHHYRYRKHDHFLKILTLFLAFIHVSILQVAARETILEQMIDSVNSGIVNSPIKDTKVFLPAYDFIIIGAGSGGSVMANRLSEERDWTVLLLELGKDETILTDVPLSAAVTSITGFNWGYRSDPVKNSCRRLNKGVCNWPKGRALGGSSVVNFLLYTRGGKLDYDEWAALGNDGWSWNEVLPYYKKLENVKIPQFRNSPYRGRNGPMDIESSPFITPLLSTFYAAGKEFGYSVVDPNGETQIGFSHAQATMRNGRRCSANKAYLKSASNRPNLFISMKSWVTRIVIDPVTKTAIGVEFLKNNRKYFIKANREVILSAGAISSPQLLMLSGVGPAEHLTQFNIPVIQDLRVGHNLQDHNSLSSLTYMVNDEVTLSDLRAQRPIHVFNYLFNNDGPLTLPGGAEGVAFIKVNNSELPPEMPDIELVMAPGSFNGDSYGSLRKLIGFTDDFYHRVFGDVIEKPAFSMVPVLMKPKSRGYIKLKSRNPFVWPEMQPNYYSHPDDMKVMLEGVKMSVKVAEAKAFKRFGAQLHSMPYPGCEKVPFRSDDYWKCLLVNYGSSLQHQSGTCKMGPPSDPDAVVNPQLQVYGIQNLRVIDASIIPTLPASHTNAVVFMIAEKGADFIKNYWKNSLYRNQSSTNFDFSSNRVSRKNQNFRYNRYSFG